MHKETNNLAKKPLKELLNETIFSEKLNDHELDELMALQNAVISPSRSNQKRYYFYGLACACVLCLSLLVNHLNLNQEKNTYIIAIANEVIENHIKLKPLDIQTNRFEDIQNFFTQVDFSPTHSKILSNHFQLKKESLLGARYCSIQGVTATQLRYKRDENSLNTFYEVAYNPEKFGFIPSVDNGESPLNKKTKGLNVSMWVESGLLMVLVAKVQ